MKLLVGKDSDLIMAIAYDIDILQTNYPENSNERVYLLKDEKGLVYDDPIQGEFYIYDTGNDPVIDKELKEADLPGRYCIENGEICMKDAYSLNEIRQVKRDVAYIINTLELNQIELMYELSLLQLGLSV